MPVAPSSTTVTDRAMKRAPGRIARRSNGQPSRFQLFTVSQLMERRRDPRDILLEIAETDTAKLAKQIGCTLLEALAERRQCAVSVLPYIAQKLPVQVDMRHTRAITLNFLDKDEYRALEAIARQSTDIDAELVSLVSPQPDNDTEPQ